MLLVRPSPQGFTTRRPSSPTRRRCVRLSPIAQDSPLLPPVGVWTVSQFQCGWPSSQTSYPSSPWWAFTPPTSCWAAGRSSAGLLLSPSNRGRRVVRGISTPCEVLSPNGGHVTHVLLTRAPLYSPPCEGFLARLACVKHAANVRSEPGSNSPVQILKTAARPPGTAVSLT